MFQWLVHEKVEQIPANSKRADAYTKKVIKVLNSKDKKYIQIFRRCHQIIDMLPHPSDDQIKRSKFTSELREKTNLVLTIPKPS